MSIRRLFNILLTLAAAALLLVLPAYMMSQSLFDQYHQLTQAQETR